MQILILLRIYFDAALVFVINRWLMTFIQIGCVAENSQVLPIVLNGILKSMKPQNSKIVTQMGGQGKSGQQKQEKLCYELTIVYLTYITLKCLSEANCVNYVIDFKCTQKWWSLTTFFKVLRTYIFADLV